jgi:hypothetical protein
MPAWVRDDKIWAQAMDRVKGKYRLSEKDGKKFWSMTTAIYKQLGGRTKKVTEGGTEQVGSVETKKELDRRGRVALKAINAQKKVPRGIIQGVNTGIDSRGSVSEGILDGLRDINEMSARDGYSVDELIKLIRDAYHNSANNWVVKGGSRVRFYWTTGGSIFKENNDNTVSLNIDLNNKSFNLTFCGVDITETELAKKNGGIYSLGTYDRNKKSFITPDGKKIKSMKAFCAEIIDVRMKADIIKAFDDCTSKSTLTEEQFLDEVIEYYMNNAESRNGDNVDLVFPNDFAKCVPIASRSSDNGKPDCWVVNADLTKLKFKFRGTTYDFNTNAFRKPESVEMGRYNFILGAYVSKFDMYFSFNNYVKMELSRMCKININNGIECDFVAKEFYVMRLGTENTSLIDNNAADLGGERDFLKQYFRSLDVDRGQFVTLFKVENLSGKYSRYDRFNGSSNKDPNRVHEPNASGESIGRERNNKDSAWYSFPRNGAWKAERVKRVPLSDVLDLAWNKYRIVPPGEDKTTYGSITNPYNYGFKDALKELFPEYKEA